MAWFQPVINAFSTRGAGDPPPEFQSFETFAQSIRTLYGDPNLERNSETALQYLKQGDRSVAEYISRFATHSQYTNFNDSALASQFYKNLHKDIKNALVTRK
jgi:Retrotransposon gag protein